MKTLYTILSFILLSITFNGQSLKEDSIAVEKFSKDELEFFNSILNFVENKIACDTFSNSKECWTYFLNNSYDSNSGGIDIKWDYEEQIEFINTLDSNLVDSIFKESYLVNKRTNDTSFAMNLVIAGLLEKIYTKAAIENKIWKDYWENIKLLYNIPPSVATVMYQTDKNLLLRDPKMRLLMSLKMMVMVYNKLPIQNK